MGAAMVMFGHRIWSAAGFKLPEPPPVLAWAAVGQFVVLAVLGVVLLVGATMLLRRNPSGRKLVLGWAVARLVMALIVIGIGLATAIPLAGLLFIIPAAALTMIQPGATFTDLALVFDAVTAPFPVIDCAALHAAVIARQAIGQAGPPSPAAA
jgi:riboflavin transporter FmnP